MRSFEECFEVENLARAIAVLNDLIEPFSALGLGKQMVWTEQGVARGIFPMPAASHSDLMK